MMSSMTSRGTCSSRYPRTLRRSWTMLLNASTSIQVSLFAANGCLNLAM